MNTIGEFSGLNRYLSNFYLAPFTWRCMEWQSSECAYQAAKSMRVEDWLAVQKMGPGEAKRYGRRIAIRADWELIKFTLMVEILTAKFRQNPELLERLRGTGLAYLEEGNTWGDRTWGVSPPGSGDGKNHLGLALMAVRAAAC